VGVSHGGAKIYFEGVEGQLTGGAREEPATPRQKPLHYVEIKAVLCEGSDFPRTSVARAVTCDSLKAKYEKIAVDSFMGWVSDVFLRAVSKVDEREPVAPPTNCKL
jgi:hypothetical protein